MQCVECQNKKYCENFNNNPKTMWGCSSGEPEYLPHRIARDINFTANRAVTKLNLEKNRYINEIISELKAIIED